MGIRDSLLGGGRLVGGTLGAAGLAGLGIVARRVWTRPVPRYRGELRVRGLGAPVQVLRDQYGIPTIVAADEHDLFLAQGFVHASERLFQMDVIRRAARGMLSEILGRPGLRNDRLMRTLGFAHVVAVELPLLEDDARACVDAFTAGVNAWIEHAGDQRLGCGIEFSMLAYEPRPWSPLDTLLIPKLFALGLCGNWEAELMRAEIAGRFGERVLALLDNDDAARAVPPQLDAAVLGELHRAARGAARIAHGGEGAGSNNWAVAPERTRTGGALLANDTHLDLSLPSAWFENGLRCPTYTVRGFSVPGSPGVAIGFNGSIAWGFTNSTADVQDLYVEQLDAPGRRYCDTDGKWKPLELRTERIGVRLGRDIELQVRLTRRGPLVSDAVDHRLDDGASGTALSLRWDAVLTPGRVAEAGYELGRARDWTAFRDALRLWSAPSQSVAYADEHGNIGMQLCGDIPVRNGSDGRASLAGTDPAGEWTGTVAFDDLPSTFNPASGFVATANDRLVGDDFPHLISRDWVNGYRGTRIRQMVERLGKGKARVEQHLAIQRDTFSLAGEALVDALRALDPRPRTSDGRIALDELLAWDFDLSATSPGGAVFGALMHELRSMLFAFLGELQAGYLGSTRGAAGGTYFAMFGRTTPRIIDDIARDDTTLLGLAVRHDPTLPGSWRDFVGRGLDRAAGRLVADCGGAWTWGAIHKLRFAHGFGFVPGAHALLSRGPFPIGGDLDTVAQASTAPKVHNTWSTVGAAQRMVVDLARPDASRAVLAGGQSGHPASPHYADQIGLYRSGGSRAMPFSEQAAGRAATTRQTLVPG